MLPASALALPPPHTHTCKHARQHALPRPALPCSWLPRELLEEMGCAKLVADVDIREAAAQGLHARPLTTAAIQAHLMALGLDPEFTTHSQVRIHVLVRIPVP